MGFNWSPFIINSNKLFAERDPEKSRENPDTRKKHSNLPLILLALAFIALFVFAYLLPKLLL